MDFFTGQELIGACKEKALPISEIMKLREMTAGSLSSEEIDSSKKSKRSWENHFLCLWQYAFEGNLL